jgi:hypothetical protein
VSTTASIVPGRYPFNVSGSASTGNHSAEVVLGVAQVNGTIPSTYFGIQVNHQHDPSWTQVAPFGAFRFWDTGTKWGETQPTEGDAFDFSHLDEWMSELKANGITHALFELSGTARWASSDPNNQNCAYADINPPENYGYCAPPTDLNADGTGADQYWRDWVAAVSQHLQSAGSANGVTIDAYEPWNEFTGQPNNWEGTNQQLVRMVQDARCIIIGNLGGSQTTEASGGQTCAQVQQSVGLSAPADPSALFLSPNTPVGQLFLSSWDSYMNTAGAADAADGYAVHLYHKTKMPVEQNLLQALLAFESDPTVVAGVQDGKPIWATEGSWNHNSDLPDPDDQAAYLARNYLLFFSVANLQRFYWYDLDEVCQTPGCNPDGNDGGTGTLFMPPAYSICTNSNGCVTEAGVAYGQVYNWMTGATQTTPCNNSPGTTIWTCGFTRKSPSGYQAEAIWDTSQTCNNGTCTTTPVTADAAYVDYRDLAGGKTTIQNNTVPVGEKPILLETLPQ